ncbi:unnamed protein product, partial [Prunus brigantina]
IPTYNAKLLTRKSGSALFPLNLVMLGLGRARDLQDNTHSIMCILFIRISIWDWTSIVGMPHVLEKGAALIARSVGKVPKATIARLNLVHVSSPYKLFILV